MILDFIYFIIHFLKFDLIKFVRDHSNQQFDILLNLCSFLKFFLARVLYFKYFLNVKVQDLESKFTFYYVS